jgi:hypothetical protein
MNAELNAIVQFRNKIGIGWLVQYQLYYRLSKLLRQIDEHTDASGQCAIVVQRFCVVLDSLITEYVDNVKVCIVKIKSPQPPIQKLRDPKDSAKKSYRGKWVTDHQLRTSSHLWGKIAFCQVILYCAHLAPSQAQTPTLYISRTLYIARSTSVN